MDADDLSDVLGGYVTAAGSAYRAFENVLLDHTRHYYRREASRSLAHNGPLIGYLDWAIHAVDEAHAAAALLPARGSRLIAAVCHVVIDETSAEIRAGIAPLLAADALEDVRRVFIQLRSLPRGTHHMLAALRTHILAVANDALEAVTTSHTAGGAAYVDAWVVAVLAVHHKFAAMVDDVFDGVEDVVKLVARATRTFLNAGTSRRPSRASTSSTSSDDNNNNGTGAPARRTPPSPSPSHTRTAACHV